MDQQNRTAHMAWVVHIINSYTRRDKLSHEDGSVQKILKISGLSSGVSPRFFYCGKTAVISVQAVTVIKHNYYRCYRATRYREKTHLPLPCKTLPKNS